MKQLSSLLIALAGLVLAGCTGYPDAIQPVKNFDKARYLGKWYEIARLDHSFERGLSRVTAEYSLRDDGGIKVVNRGYSAKDGWKEADGKAYFVGDDSVGHLKVSFFGPFYASYVVFWLDPDYRISYVGGVDKDYLWLLARTPVISDEERARFIKVAREKGYDVDNLIWLDNACKQDVQPGLC